MDTGDKGIAAKEVSCYVCHPREGGDLKCANGIPAFAGMTDFMGDRIKYLISELPTSFRLFRAETYHYAQVIGELAWHGKKAREAVPRLTELLKDDDAYIQQEAFCALLAIDGSSQATLKRAADYCSGLPERLYLRSSLWGRGECEQALLNVRASSARLLAMNGDETYAVKMTNELLDDLKKAKSYAEMERIRELLKVIGKYGFETIVDRIYDIFDFGTNDVLVPVVASYIGEVSDRLVELAVSDQSYLSLFALTCIRHSVLGDGGKSFKGDIAKLHDVYVRLIPRRWERFQESEYYEERIGVIENIFAVATERSLGYLIQDLNSDNDSLLRSVIPLLGQMGHLASPAFDSLKTLATTGGFHLQTLPAINAMGKIARYNNSVDLAGALAPFIIQVDALRTSNSLEALHNGLTTRFESVAFLLPFLERILKEGRLNAEHLTMARHLIDRIEGGTL